MPGPAQPGPLAAQLAMYMGYVDYRVRGATLVGLAFVLPSFVRVVLLGWLLQQEERSVAAVLGQGSQTGQSKA